MKTVLCFFFLALTELLPSTAAVTSSKTLNPFLRHLFSCSNAWECLNSIDPLKSMCGTWREARECMIDANCPDFVIDSAGAELRERFQQTCSGMATGQVCRNIHELHSRLMDAKQKMTGLCVERWQYFGPCFVKASCPERVLYEFSVMFKSPGMNCSSEREMISPVPKTTTSSKEPQYGWTTTASKEPQHGGTTTGSKEPQHGGATTGSKEPQHGGPDKQHFFHTETEATSVNTTEQTRSSLIRTRKKRESIFSLAAAPTRTAGPPFDS